MAVLAVGMVLALGASACGDKSETPNIELRETLTKELLCNLPGTDLDLHNSGISCQQAGAILVLRSSGAEDPQVLRSGEETWICRDRSTRRRKIVKCSSGDRSFTAAGRRSPAP